MFANLIWKQSKVAISFNLIPVKGSYFLYTHLPLFLCSFMLIKRFAHDKLEWTHVYTREKVVQLVTLYNLERSSHGELRLDHIVKRRVRNGVACLEVAWKLPGNFTTISVASRSLPSYRKEYNILLGLPVWLTRKWGVKLLSSWKEFCLKLIRSLDDGGKWMDARTLVEEVASLRTSYDFVAHIVLMWLSAISIKGVICWEPTAVKIREKYGIPLWEVYLCLHVKDIHTHFNFVAAPSVLWPSLWLYHLMC